MKAPEYRINVENPYNSRILCITQTVTHSWFTRFPQGVVEKKPNALVDQGFTCSRLHWVGGIATSLFDKALC